MGGGLICSMGQKSFYWWMLPAGMCCPMKWALRRRRYKSWGWLSIYQLNVLAFNYSEAFPNFASTTNPSFVPTSTHLCHSPLMGLFLKDDKGGCLTPLRSWDSQKGPGDSSFRTRALMQMRCFPHVSWVSPLPLLSSKGTPRSIYVQCWVDFDEHFGVSSWCSTATWK